MAQAFLDIDIGNTEEHAMDMAAFQRGCDYIAAVGSQVCDRCPKTQYPSATYPFVHYFVQLSPLSPLSTALVHRKT